MKKYAIYIPVESGYNSTTYNRSGKWNKVKSKLIDQANSHGRGTEVRDMENNLVHVVV